MVESATNKLLHAPTTRLRTAAASSDGNDLVRALEHLFDLPAQPEPESEKKEAAASGTVPGDDESEKRLPH
jgi:hypothetical protein